MKYQKVLTFKLIKIKTFLIVFGIVKLKNSNLINQHNSQNYLKITLDMIKDNIATHVPTFNNPIEKNSLRELKYPNLQTELSVDKKDLKKGKLSILVISEVHRNRIDNPLSVEIANHAIKRLNQLSEGRFIFYSDYKDEFPQTLSYCQTMPKLDFVLTVGTNHTLMYTFYRLENETTPPILGFSCEGESTLFNFTKCDLDLILQSFVDKVKQNQIYQYVQTFPKLQMLHKNIIKNITCEIEIGRGKNPALVKMELYCRNKNQQQEIYIGKLWGDGLVISTAFGSVSRSMVLNGPIIHKKIESLIVTPVCPLSLKFRPIVLPIDCHLIIKVDENSRAQGTVYIDGVNTKQSVKPGQTIVISKSNLKTTMVANLNGSYEKTLFLNLQQFLSWGEQFSSKDYKDVETCEKIHG